MKHAQSSHHSPFDDSRLVAIISAEGEVARGVTDKAIDQACSALGWTGRAQVQRIADLGSGPGSDACALAAAFPAATVAAVDSSAAMLAAAVRRAEAAGVGGRVEAVALGLDDDDLTALGPLDLAWAALSLHHVRDSAATLVRIAAQLRPGGGLCVLERHAPLELRPTDDLGRPGLWERVNRAQGAWYQRARATHASHSDLAQLVDQVASAGLTIVHAGTLESTTTRPASPVCEVLVNRHVQLALSAFRDTLEPGDTVTLQAPDVLARLHRSAVEFTSTRLLVVAAAR